MVLLHQLAAHGSEGSDQAGSQKNEGRRLGSGAAGAAENVEGALGLRAIGVPGGSTIGGIQIQTGGAVTKVPGQPAVFVDVRGAEHQEVVLASGEVDAADAGDANQSAASAKFRAAG